MSKRPPKHVRVYFDTYHDGVVRPTSAYQPGEKEYAEHDGLDGEYSYQYVLIPRTKRGAKRRKTRQGSETTT